VSRCAEWMVLTPGLPLSFEEETNPGRDREAAMRTCRCGHRRSQHQHLRPGNECSAGGCACEAYHRKRLFSRPKPIPAPAIVKAASKGDSKAA
jgi:hypothetical protein